MTTDVVAWVDIAQAAGSRGLLAFQKVWTHQGPLAAPEKAHLENIFHSYPLGTTDFRVWAKQRARQLFENSLREGIHA